jgi:uracil phosphoribosyltransferase
MVMEKGTNQTDGHELRKARLEKLRNEKTKPKTFEALEQRIGHLVHNNAIKHQPTPPIHQLFHIC